MVFSLFLSSFNLNAQVAVQFGGGVFHDLYKVSAEEGKVFSNLENLFEFSGYFDFEVQRRFGNYNRGVIRYSRLNYHNHYNFTSEDGLFFEGVGFSVGSFDSYSIMYYRDFPLDNSFGERFAISAGIGLGVRRAKKIKTGDFSGGTSSTTRNGKLKSESESMYKISSESGLSDFVPLVVSLSYNFYKEFDIALKLGYELGLSTLFSIALSSDIKNYNDDGTFEAVKIRGLAKSSDIAYLGLGLTYHF